MRLVSASTSWRPPMLAHSQSHMPLFACQSPTTRFAARVSHQASHTAIAVRIMSKDDSEHSHYLCWSARQWRQFLRFRRQIVYAKITHNTVIHASNATTGRYQTSDNGAQINLPKIEKAASVVSPGICMRRFLRQIRAHVQWSNTAYIMPLAN